MTDPTAPVWTPENPAPAPLQSAQAGGTYLRIDDNVRITTFNSATGVTVACRTRMVDLVGYVQVASDLQTPNTDRTAKASIFGSDEGWLLGGSVVVTAGAPLEGQCFVVVEIVRGLGASALALEQIAAGYVTAKQPLRFPSLSSIRSLDGGGALRSITGATPGAGVIISETVPTGARWELLTFQFQFVTAVAVANRRVSLTLDDGANGYASITANFTQTASLTEFYVWAQAFPSLIDANLLTILAPLPGNIRLGSGHRIRSTTSAIQGADQFSAVQYLVREWLEGA